MKTLRITDQQTINLIDILTKEFMAGYTTHKEKSNADELLMIIRSAHWEPDTDALTTTAYDSDDSLFHYKPSLWLRWTEVEA